MNKTIECILKHHDDLSFGAVFNPTDEARQACYTQSVALRNLLKRIQKDVIPQKDKQKFEDVIEAHYSSMSALLLWNRKLELEDDEDVKS